MQTAEGQAVLRRFASEPRISAMKDMMLCYGSRAHGFQLHELAMWFLWSAERHGVPATEKFLDDYFARDENSILITQWIQGITVDDVIQLGDGYEIRSLAEMPTSQEKERFSTPWPFAFHDPPTPQCALVSVCSLPKLCRVDEAMPPNPELDRIRIRLGFMPLLLNTLEGISCLPRYITSYGDDQTPCGPFGGGGGGIPHYDVIGMGLDLLTPSQATEIMPLVEAFERQPADERHHLQLILFRLCQAKRHMRAEDKVLDLGVALEMALLDDDRDQAKAKTFRSRGSLLLATSRAHAAQLRFCFDQIYDARSRVVHRGSLWDANYPGKMGERIAAIPEWLMLASRVVQKLILHGKPKKW
ncbi:MAG: hypothetical protein EXS38_08020 [Opitutus sp.]|nr:hypothetical protein [Opitutus sp.]